MKKSSIILMMALAAFVFEGCKKKSTETVTPTLEVEESSQVLVAKHTWTGCGQCGGWGFTNFESNIDSYPDEVHVAFKKGNVGPYNNEAIYDHIQAAFDIPTGTPKFHNNLDATLNIPTAEQNLIDNGVILNANYEMTFEGDKIKLNTTTKFFQNTVGKYYLAPFLVVDNIEASQQGHPDTPNTLHKKVVVDIAKPVGEAQSNYNGYLIASGDIKAGHTINLECEVDRDAAWLAEDVSFALMMFREKADGSLEFINVMSK